MSKRVPNSKSAPTSKLLQTYQRTTHPTEEQKRDAELRSAYLAQFCEGEQLPYSPEKVLKQIQYYRPPSVVYDFGGEEDDLPAFPPAHTVQDDLGGWWEVMPSQDTVLHSIRPKTTVAKHTLSATQCSPHGYHDKLQPPVLDTQITTALPALPLSPSRSVGQHHEHSVVPMPSPKIRALHVSQDVDKDTKVHKKCPKSDPSKHKHCTEKVEQHPGGTDGVQVTKYLSEFDKCHSSSDYGMCRPRDERVERKDFPGIAWTQSVEDLLTLDPNVEKLCKSVCTGVPTSWKSFADTLDEINSSTYKGSALPVGHNSSQSRNLLLSTSYFRDAPTTTTDAVLPPAPPFLGLPQLPTSVCKSPQKTTNVLEVEPARASSLPPDLTRHMLESQTQATKLPVPKLAYANKSLPDLTSFQHVSDHKNPQKLAVLSERNDVSSDIQRTFIPEEVVGLSNSSNLPQTGDLPEMMVDDLSSETDDLPPIGDIGDY